MQQGLWASNPEDGLVTLVEFGPYRELLKGTNISPQSLRYYFFKKDMWLESLIRSAYA